MPLAVRMLAFRGEMVKKDHPRGLDADDRGWSVTAIEVVAQLLDRSSIDQGETVAAVCVSWVVNGVEVLATSVVVEVRVFTSCGR